MLKIQEYLQNGGSMEALKTERGIGSYRHPKLPLIGFKYQANAPKDDPIVRECRGIVLEAESWDLVAKPFDRFFNAGEDLEAFASFHWNQCWCQSKEDGSLVILYNYRGTWFLNTSGSFGTAKVSFSDQTWIEHFQEAIGIDLDQFNPKWTYLFELCSPFLKVVRVYPRAIAFLLSVFDPQTTEELSIRAVDDEAARLDLRQPERFEFRSMAEVSDYLLQQEREDPTFEGLVLRDDRNLRFKIKTRTYLDAHHAVGESNLFNPKYLVPLILTGEQDEIIAYHPELREHADRIAAKIETAYQELRSLWESTSLIADQKEFAGAIVGRTPFARILFVLRSRSGMEQSEIELRKLWSEHPDLIHKVLFERTL